MMLVMDTPISDPRPAAGRPTRAQAQARQAALQRLRAEARIERADTR